MADILSAFVLKNYTLISHGITISFLDLGFPVSNCAIPNFFNNFYLKSNLFFIKNCEKIGKAHIPTPFSKVHTLFLQLGNINHRLPSSTRSSLR